MAPRASISFNHPRATASAGMRLYSAETTTVTGPLTSTLLNRCKPRSAEAFHWNPLREGSGTTYVCGFQAYRWLSPCGALERLGSACPFVPDSIYRFHRPECNPDANAST